MYCISLNTRLANVSYSPSLIILFHIVYILYTFPFPTFCHHSLPLLLILIKLLLYRYCIVIYSQHCFPLIDLDDYDLLDSDPLILAPLTELQVDISDYSGKNLHIDNLLFIPSSILIFSFL